MADLPGDNDVPIELDGKELLLSPSLGACLAISKIAGGLNAAVNRCLALDMDTICQVVAAGLTLNPKQASLIPQAVYATGLMNLSAPCVEFIHIVANGGKRPPMDDEEDGEGAKSDPPMPASP